VRPAGYQRLPHAARLAVERRVVVRCLFLLAGILALVALTAPHAAAQGCAMCYQNAAASGEQGRAALRHGILILLLPALSLFFGIFALIYRRNNPVDCS